jgi:hypothetical protein
MMTSVDFRGIPRDVEYRDYGYEPDTGAHTIDWHFVEEEMQGVELTAEEEESIYMQLAEIGPDHWPDDVI